jgi:hypothetical protein
MVSPSPLVQLATKFDNEPWYYSVGQDQFGRYVVYAKYMSSEVLSSVPQTHDGKQLLVHFASYATAARDVFTSVPKSIFHTPEKVSAPDTVVDIKASLDKLIMACGLDNVIEIFHEIHDGDKALTSLSKSYPKLRKTMEALYDEFGFDVLYEELGD